MFLGHFWPFSVIFARWGFLPKNSALSHITRYGPLTPCWVWEKTNEPTLIKLTDRRKDGRTDGQILFHRTLPAETGGPKRVQDCSCDGFSASDGWLDGWKTACTIKERWTVGEAGDVSEEMITSWMETLEELTAKYSSENIWKMDKSGCFFKALSDKAFVEKAIKQEVAKIQSKNSRLLFCWRCREKEPAVIWKSWMSRCFRELKDPSRPTNVHYFSVPKSWNWFLR